MPGTLEVPGTCPVGLPIAVAVLPPSRHNQAIVKILGAPSLVEWEESARVCEWATFFHTPTWSGILLDTFPYLRDATLAFEMADGARVVLPLSLRRRGMGGFLQERLSTFPGTYGGPLASRRLTPEELSEVCGSVPAGLRCLRVRILGTPFWDLGPAPKGFRTEPLSTRMLDLSPGFGTLVRGLSTTHRRGLAKAEGHGLTVRAAKDLEEYQEYFRIYEDTLERWQHPTSRYPMDLFRNIHRLGGEYVRLWLVLKTGEIIAGALVFYWNRHAVYWHGASRSEFFSMRPNIILHSEIIRFCCEQGYRYYDFNPSGGHVGVDRFKALFGAGEWPVSHWIREPNPVFRLYRKTTGNETKFYPR